jgi:hypothetical protein
MLDVDVLVDVLRCEPVVLMVEYALSLADVRISIIATNTNAVILEMDGLRKL